ncbi:NAD(P)-dependent oxidoreductase [Vibrio parahaemolyticus]|nr:NAD(P)-dependent oxidoreductase [Vibrio parahaemolyticus]ELB2097686.1 NAD(P)-dependent oxidoreductase [Vibrio parahaemolyticus]ELB2207408.1 NAD(P)-dependent oxidoreductase [Vibrio parahaemolyticus]ELB2289038.1 NAD(P)-dependent oxidoreductase [Vibrio parahaemolyticus]HCG8161480.1 NAD(P)-dependent oxidoreductase [Vibrio parahaemolyticus]
MGLENMFTVFGGQGFIGSEFVKQLEMRGEQVFIPKREEPDIYDKELGTIIYCAGYGDCEKDPYNVINANVFLLSNILQRSHFDKLVYVSSTRIYMNNIGSNPDGDVSIICNDSRRLFNLTKLTAEEICIKSKKDCFIIRPSNVFGLAINSPLFLPSITRNAINNGYIDMYVTEDYAKDYVYVGDVVKSTLQILDSKKDKPRIVNIASGVNTTAKEIADILKNKTGCNVNWHNIENDKEQFPITDITEMKKHIDFEPIQVTTALEKLVDKFIRALSNEKSEW